MHETLTHIGQIDRMVAEQFQIAHTDDATTGRKVVLKQIQLHGIHHHLKMPRRIQTLGLGTLLVRGVEAANHRTAIGTKRHDRQQKVSAFALALVETMSER